MIPSEIVRFGISRRVHNKLQDMETLQSRGLEFVVHQCIAAGDLVRKVHRKNLRLYADNRPLDFPQPARRSLNHVYALEVQVHPEAFRAFKRIRKDYELDPHSALSWCISCYDIIEEARMLETLFSRGRGQETTHRPLWT